MGFPGFLEARHLKWMAGEDRLLGWPGVFVRMDGYLPTSRMPYCSSLALHKSNSC
jgi:hypothetical protein